MRQKNCIWAKTCRGSCLVDPLCVNPVAVWSVFVIGAAKSMIVWMISVGTAWLISITDANEAARIGQPHSLGWSGRSYFPSRRFRFTR